MRGDIIKVDVLVAPLEVVNDTLISQLILHGEDVLEEVDDALIDVKVVEFCDHSLLIFQIFLIEINQRVAFINDTADVFKGLCVTVALKLRNRVIQRLVFSLFPLQLKVHVLDLSVVAIELPQDHLLVITLREPVLNLFKVVDDFG